jgi:prevent-host-death family protein
MSLTVNVLEAKTRLSELLGRVQLGEDIVIAKAGSPVARLVPFGQPADREFGQMDFVVPDSFFEPLNDEELAAWE